MNKDKKMLPRPVNDRILIQLDPQDSMDRLIWIPETAREKPRSGVVLAVGPGKVMKDGRRRPVDVPVGARIMFGKHALDRELPGGLAFTTEMDVALVLEAAA